MGQGGIPAAVAEGVVDALEVVDVEDGEHHLALTSLGIGEQLLGLLHEQGAIDQLREAVGLGSLSELWQQAVVEQIGQQQRLPTRKDQTHQEHQGQILAEIGQHHAGVVVHNQQQPLALEPQITVGLLHGANHREAAGSQGNLSRVEIHAVVRAALETAHNRLKIRVIGLRAVEQRIGDVQADPTGPRAVHHAAGRVERQQHVHAVELILAIGGRKGLNDRLPGRRGDRRRERRRQHLAHVLSIGDHLAVTFDQVNNGEAEGEQASGPQPIRNQQPAQKAAGLLDGIEHVQHQDAPR